jgi:hypothetical protein
MKYSDLLWKSALLGFVLAMIGCGGTTGTESGLGASQYAPTNMVDQAAKSLVVTTAHHAVHPDSRKSWMKHEANNQRLLYVSDVATDDVDVYAYKSGSLVGQLTGFNEPQGICSDKAGNVYITNTLDSNIFEYAHGGTSPVQKFDDPGQLPVDCDATIDGLTAANIGTTGGGVGSLSIYEGTRLIVTVTSQRLAKIYSVAYLPVVFQNFMTAENAAGQTYYAKFAYGDKIRPLKTPIASPGSVRFSGIRKEMAVGDQKGTIYLVHGTAVSTKIELGGLCAAGQFSITQTNIAVPDPCGGKVSVYAFPKGGAAIRSITASLVQPVGTAVSPNDLRGP